MNTDKVAILTAAGSGMGKVAGMVTCSAGPCGASGSGTTSVSVGTMRGGGREDGGDSACIGSQLPAASCERTAQPRST